MIKQNLIKQLPTGKVFNEEAINRISGLLRNNQTQQMSSSKKHPHEELALYLLQGVAMAQMLVEEPERKLLALAKGEDLGRKAVFVVISFAVVTNDP